VIITETNVIYNEDCLEGMKRLPDKSIDMILCDLPYGTTDNKWDVIIPFDLLWAQYERVIKDNGAIVLTGSQPFTSKLVMSNQQLFRYEWIWEKSFAPNFQLANKMPMKIHENILVFYKKLPVYNKQMIPRTSSRIKDSIEKGYTFPASGDSDNYAISRVAQNAKRYDPDWKNPETVLRINNLKNNSKEKVGHPTQKPVALFEYLIKTYTNKGDVVLDNCIGSGTTAIACLNTDRKFIGFETNEEYFRVAQDRIKNNVTQIDLFG